MQCVWPTFWRLTHGDDVQTARRRVEFMPSFKDARVYVCGEDFDMVTGPQNNAMTLHHLLTHTSGLTYGFGNPGLIPDLYQARHTDFEPHDGPLQEVVDRLVQIPFEFQPGQRWNCGVSLDVLGRVVAVASGKPLDVFFKEHIFEPLGMKDTGFAALYKHTDENDLTLLEAPPASSIIDATMIFAAFEE